MRQELPRGEGDPGEKPTSPKVERKGTSCEVIVWEINNGEGVGDNGADHLMGARVEGLRTNMRTNLRCQQINFADPPQRRTAEVA